MVEIRYLGGLGNRMFQYCLGRILAEHLGFALKADPIPEFPNTRQRVAGASYQTPELVFTGQQLDLAGILANRSPRKIVLHGWFQRHEYYRQHRERIREWFAVPSIAAADFQADIAVHVRRTDYLPRQWALPFAFYKAALEYLNAQPGHVWIATEDRKDPFFRHFRAWKPHFSNGSPLEDLLFLTRARNLVMSQSTFSWWPTFLGEHQKVVCAVTKYGAWSELGEGAADSNLIEPDRFVCLGCKTPYQANARERRHRFRCYLQRRAIASLRYWFKLPPRESVF